MVDAEPLGCVDYDAASEDATEVIRQ